MKKNFISSRIMLYMALIAFALTSITFSRYNYAAKGTSGISTAKFDYTLTHAGQSFRDSFSYISKGSTVIKDTTLTDSDMSTIILEQDLLFNLVVEVVPIKIKNDSEVEIINRLSLSEEAQNPLGLCWMIIDDEELNDTEYDNDGEIDYLAFVSAHLTDIKSNKEFSIPFLDEKTYTLLMWVDYTQVVGGIYNDGTEPGPLESQALEYSVSLTVDTWQAKPEN